MKDNEERLRERYRGEAFLLVGLYSVFYVKNVMIWHHLVSVCMEKTICHFGSMYLLISISIYLPASHADKSNNFISSLC